MDKDDVIRCLLFARRSKLGFLMDRVVPHELPADIAGRLTQDTAGVQLLWDRYMASRFQIDVTQGDLCVLDDAPEEGSLPALHDDVWPLIRAAEDGAAGFLAATLLVTDKLGYAEVWDRTYDYQLLCSLLSSERLRPWCFSPRGLVYAARLEARRRSLGEVDLELLAGVAVASLTEEMASAIRRLDLPSDVHEALEWTINRNHSSDHLAESRAAALWTADLVDVAGSGVLRAYWHSQDNGRYAPRYTDAWLVDRWIREGGHHLGELIRFPASRCAPVPLADLMARVRPSCWQQLVAAAIRSQGGHAVDSDVTIEFAVAMLGVEPCSEHPAVLERRAETEKIANFLAHGPQSALSELRPTFAERGCELRIAGQAYRHAAAALLARGEQHAPRVARAWITAAALRKLMELLDAGEAERLEVSIVPEDLRVPLLWP